MCSIVCNCKIAKSIRPNTGIGLMLSSLLFLRAFLSTRAANNEGTGTIADLENMFDKVEADTLAFARQMEELQQPANRCSTTTIQLCSEANYEGCNSELPNATCPGYEYAIPACGQGEEGGCGGLFDFTASLRRVYLWHLGETCLALICNHMIERKMEFVIHSREKST